MLFGKPKEVTIPIIHHISARFAYLPTPLMNGGIVWRMPYYQFRAETTFENELGSRVSYTCRYLSFDESAKAFNELTGPNTHAYRPHPGYTFRHKFSWLPTRVNSR